MNRLVPALAIPVLAGIPVWMGNSRPVEFVAGAGGALCLLAVLRASLALATTGAAVALLALALALRQAPSSANVVMLVAFGSALLLLIDGTWLCRRIDGAEVPGVLWRRHVAWWIGRAAISLGSALIIAIVAPLVALALPQPWAPLLAGIGILAAFAAAVALARRSLK